MANTLQRIVEFGRRNYPAGGPAERYMGVKAADVNQIIDAVNLMLTGASNKIYYTISGIVANAGGGATPITPLLADVNIVDTVATALDSVTLPSVETGMCITVKNAGANTLAVYPFTSDTIDDLTTTEYVSIASGNSCTFIGTSTVKWESLPSGSTSGSGTGTGHFYGDYQDSVINFSTAAAATATTGYRYIASSTAGGWTANRIYEYDGNSWQETIPNKGFTILNENDNKVYTHNGTDWTLTKDIDLTAVYLYGGATSGDDLVLQANSADAYPTITLNGLGEIDINSGINITPSTNVDAIDIVGTNMTTSSVLHFVGDHSVSGTLFNIDLTSTGTNQITAPSVGFCIYDTRTHDATHADAIVGYQIYSGTALTGAVASTISLFDGAYGGTLGSAGALSTVNGVNLNFLGMTHTNGTLNGINITMPATYGAGTESAIYITGNGSIIRMLGDTGIRFDISTATGVGTSYYCNTVNGNSAKQNITAQRNITGALTANANYSTYANIFSQASDNSSALDFNLTDTATTSGMFDINFTHNTSANNAGGVLTSPDEFRGTVMNFDVIGQVDDANSKLNFRPRVLNISYNTAFGAAGVINYEPVDIARIDWNIASGTIINTATAGGYITGINIDGNGFVPGATVGVSTIITGALVNWTDAIINDADANLYGYKAIMPYSNNNTTNAINSAFIAIGTTNVNINNTNKGYTEWCDASNTVNGTTVTSTGTFAEYLSTLTANQAAGGCTVTRSTNPLINVAITTDATNAADVVNITSGFINMSVTKGGAGTTNLYGNMVGLTIAGTADAQILRGYYLNADNITLLTTSEFYGFDIDASGLTNTSSNACYGGRIVVGGTSDGALYTSDGTHILTLSSGTAHIASTTSMITEMPVPTIGSGFGNALLAKWLPFGQRGVSGMKVTEFYLDLTGLQNSGTQNDIIGDDGENNCHFGQITAAVHGTVDSIEIICTEAPTGADADIDFGCSSASNGAENADMTALAGYVAVLTAGANWTAGMVKVASGMPTADFYMYIGDGAGAGGDATYTAGKFIIRIYGTI